MVEESCSVTEEMRRFAAASGGRAAVSAAILRAADSAPCLVEVSGDVVCLVFFLPRVA